MSAPAGRPRPARAAALRAWIAVALWTLLVWTLSADAFSADSTSRILEPLVRWLWPAVRPDALEWIHGAVRKAAHAIEYAILGVLVLRALRIGSERPASHSAALAFAFALAVSAADEGHQARSAARSGSARDVALDAGGAVLGIAVAALGFRRRSGAGSLAPIPPTRGGPT